MSLGHRIHRCDFEPLFRNNSVFCAKNQRWLPVEPCGALANNLFATCKLKFLLSLPNRHIADHKVACCAGASHPEIRLTRSHAAYGSFLICLAKQGSLVGISAHSGLALCDLLTSFVLTVEGALVTRDILRGLMGVHHILRDRNAPRQRVALWVNDMVSICRLQQIA